MLLKETKTFVLSRTYISSIQTSRGHKPPYRITPWQYRLEWYTNHPVTQIDREILYL